MKLILFGEGEKKHIRAFCQDSNSIKRHILNSRRSVNVKKRSLKTDLELATEPGKVSVLSVAHIPLLLFYKLFFVTGIWRGNSKYGAAGKQVCQLVGVRPCRAYGFDDRCTKAGGKQHVASCWGISGLTWVKRTCAIQEWAGCMRQSFSRMASSCHCEEPAIWLHLSKVQMHSFVLPNNIFFF